jgi:hypothetical protein
LRKGALDADEQKTKRANANPIPATFFFINTSIASGASSKLGLYLSHDSSQIYDSHFGGQIHISELAD